MKLGGECRSRAEGEHQHRLPRSCGNAAERPLALFREERAAAALLDQPHPPQALNGNPVQVGRVQLALGDVAKRQPFRCAEAWIVALFHGGHITGGTSPRPEALAPWLTASYLEPSKLIES